MMIREYDFSSQLAANCMAAYEDVRNRRAEIGVCRRRRRAVLPAVTITGRDRNVSDRQQSPAFKFSSSSRALRLCQAAKIVRQGGFSAGE
jgi:hypothetical protein